MRRRLLLATTVAVVALVFTGTSAWAYFVTGGSGNGSAAVGTLAAPTGVEGVATGASVALTWSESADPLLGAVTYTVERTPVPSGPAVAVCGTVSTTSCTDTPVDVGSYTYVVTAHALSWTATSAPGATVDVVPDPTPDPNPPIIDTTPLATATAGQIGYFQQLVLVGSGPSVTWAVVDGTLPTGLTLDPTTGVVTGDVDLAAISTTFTVEATDTLASTDQATFTLTVYALEITTTTPPAATVGEPGYSSALAATGGAPGHLWQLTSGSPPAGITFDPTTAVLSGEALTAAGTETFTISVADDNGVVAVSHLTISVTSNHVQEFASTQTTGNRTSVGLLLGDPVAAGDTLVVTVAQPCRTSTGTLLASEVTGVTWSSSAFTRAVATGCSAQGDAEIWYLHGTSAAAGGSTVTVTLAKAVVASYVNVTEYHGVTGRDPAAGATSHASGPSTTVVPGSVTPSGPGELVVATAYVAQPTLASLGTQLAPYLLQGQRSPFLGYSAYVIDPDTSPIGPGYTQGAPGAWAGVQCAFELGS